jgi:hypothetical protein
MSFRIDTDAPLPTGTATIGTVVSVGNVASGATDSGNPVKVGGKYNTTLPTLTDGQRGDLQTDAKGNMRVLSVDTLAAGADALSNSNMGYPIGSATLSTGVLRTSGSYYFNGTTWDRARGNTTGAFVVPTAATVGGASFLNIAAGQATTVVKASAGTLYAIVLNSAATATNTTTVYDNASGAGTVIGRPAVTTATVPTTLSFGATGLAFANGLTIITATANGGDMTVIYK